MGSLFMPHNVDRPTQTDRQGDVERQAECIAYVLCIHTSNMHSFINSFIQAISITPLKVQYYSEALPTQHGVCRSFHAKRHRQLRVKDLPKVPTWLLG